MRAPFAAALLAVLLASAPMAAVAAGSLSDGTVTPTSGTTSDVFTFSVHYVSSGSPSQPAQSVWVEIAGITVPLIKISGSANDGTWQGTAMLPAGSWVAIFHATTSADPQPTPLVGPVVTVTGPPPPPTSDPTPEPTAPPPPPPTSAPTTAPIPQPTSGADPTAAPGLPSSSANASGSDPEATSDASAGGTVSSAAASVVLESSEARDEDGASPGSMLASFLIVGGTMSIAGALVLARQWYVTRKGGRG